MQRIIQIHLVLFQLLLALPIYGNTVRILFRANPTSIDGLDRFQLARENKDNPYGHVAIELPEGAHPEGRIFGWKPTPLYDLGDEYYEIWSECHKGWKSPEYVYQQLWRKPGSLQLDHEWAARGTKARTRTMYIEFQVSDDNLNTIVSNMKQFTRKFYELIPDSEDAYNCVTSIGALLEGTGIYISIPERGHLQAAADVQEKGPDF